MLTIFTSISAINMSEGDVFLPHLRREWTIKYEMFLTVSDVRSKKSLSKNIFRLMISFSIFAINLLN